MDQRDTIGCSTPGNCSNHLALECLELLNQFLHLLVNITSFKESYEFGGFQQAGKKTELCRMALSIQMPILEHELVHLNHFVG